MDQKETMPIDILDGIHWLKLCFRLRQEMRVLEEEKKTELYVFVIALLLGEETKIWEDLEKDLKNYE